MSLIKQIHTALIESELTQKQQHLMMMEKIEAIVSPSDYPLLFETAEQFLSQLMAAIQSGKNVEASDAARIAAKLTTLQLIGDSNTRGSALSQLAGDSSKKISTIMSKTSGMSDSDNQVDKILITLANKIGKSGTQQNTQMLTNLEKMPEKTRNQKAAEIQRLVGMFKQLGAKVTQSTKQGDEPVTAAA